MARLFKESMTPINLRLTSGSVIRLVPSIGCESDTMVMGFSSEDIDLAYRLNANEWNYRTLQNHIRLGRYSQALDFAAFQVVKERVCAPGLTEAGREILVGSF